MKSIMFTTTIVIALLIGSIGWATQGDQTCREQNLQSLIDQIERTDGSEQAKMLISTLKRQLRVERVKREKQVPQKASVAFPESEQPAGNCFECSGEEQGESR